MQIKEKIIAHKYDISILGAIVLILFYQIMRCGDLPGLYFDAVNPDSWAVQILFPGVSSVSPKYAQTGIPLIAQLYHGTFTVLLQILVVGILGKPSLFTVRLCDAIYIFLICIVIYIICKSIIKNRAMLFLMMITLAMSPQVFSFMRTQFYIKLPGIFLTLLGFCFLMRQKKPQMGGYILAAGLLQGLAFYTYFIYLFFVPAIIVICIYYAKKQNRSVIKDVFVWVSGFGTGCLLYVAGYCDLIITQLNISRAFKKGLVYTIEIVLLIGGSALIYLVNRYYSKDSVLKKIGIVLGVLCGSAVLVGAICYKKIIAILTPLVKAVNLFERKLTFFERIKVLKNNSINILKNLPCEWLMMKKGVSVFAEVYVYITVALAIITLILFIFNRKNIKMKVYFEVWGGCWGLLLSYYCFALIFIQRMGTQHFTPVWIILFFILIQEVNILYLLSQEKLFRYLLGGILAVLLLLNVINCNLICTNLEITKGEGMYTNHINEIASNALKNKEMGELEVYVFPESGLGRNFVYLTMNQITLRGLNPQNLSGYVEDGYRIRVYYWDYENREDYIAKLKEAGITEFTEEIFLSGTGTETLYSLIQTLQK